MWDLSDTTILVKAPHVDNGVTIRSFYIVNTNNGNKISCAYDSLPQQVKDEPQTLLYQSTSVISPDRRHFATAITIGGMLEIFSLNATSISPIVSEYVFRVAYADDYNYKASETQNGFSSLTADNEYLYGAFSGTTDPNDMTKIGVWKWNGMPVKLIETDALILKMTLCDRGKSIVAIIQTDQNDLRIAKIRLK